MCKSQTFKFDSKILSLRFLFKNVTKWKKNKQNPQMLDFSFTDIKSTAKENAEFSDRAVLGLLAFNVPNVNSSYYER